ncbi:hypothetical protein TrCOL_g10498 [Triparma columacea]|uniref:Cystatin domain-containing protein n=1 Tax=Triparma columacea TaxID=722753 RepID=A0A9W7GMA6_9STRA|nr:hypothetical protein TrCOL_g10498 [Triparma columacea]
MPDMVKALVLALLVGVTSGMQMMGGRSPVDVNTQGVQTAATHFVSNHNDSNLSRSNFKVLKAEQQVVAGINYYLTIQIGFANGGEACGDVKDVVVYDKFGTLSLTSVRDVGCGGEADKE